MIRKAVNHQSLAVGHHRPHAVSVHPDSRGRNQAYRLKHDWQVQHPAGGPRQPGTAASERWRIGCWLAVSHRCAHQVRLYQGDEKAECVSDSQHCPDPYYPLWLIRQARTRSSDEVRGCRGHPAGQVSLSERPGECSAGKPVVTSLFERTYASWTGWSRRTAGECGAGKPALPGVAARWLFL